MLLALAIVAGASLDRAREHREAIDVTSEASDVEHTFEDRVIALLRHAQEDADAAGAPGRWPGEPPAGFTDVVAVGTGADGPAAGDLAPIGDPLAHPHMRAALDLAADRAEVIVTSPIVTRSAAVPAVVVAVYRTDDGSLGTRTTAIGAARRDAVEAWWVGTLDLDLVAEEALATSARTDLGLRITDGATVLVDSGPSDFATRRSSIAATAPRTWELAVGAAAAPPTSGPAVAVTVAGIVLATAVGGLAWWVDRRRRALTAARDEARTQLALVTEIGPVVQRSLELADVLPTVALRLIDDLGLAGVACSLTGERGRPVDLFAVGSPVDRDAPVRLSLPPEVRAGETLALSLQRAGRSVGVLRVRSDRAMTGAEIGSLSAIAELAAAAIVNARLFEQQQEAVARLQEVDQLKTVFLGTASHELRTPVTAIVGFTRLLVDRWEDLEESQRLEYTQRIVRNAEALERLVQDLLDFARLERGGLRTSRDRVELSQVVAHAVRGIELAHPDHHLVVEVDDDVTAVGDRSGVERVLNNLVSNATKYSPAGSTVRIAVRRTPDGAELVVDDEGPGIAEADRRRIFSRFFRGAGDEVVRTRGAGIGLSVVEEFVHQMGAEISVGDAPTGGARFLVRFAPWREPEAEAPRPEGVAGAEDGTGEIEEDRTGVPRT